MNNENYKCENMNYRSTEVNLENVLVLHIITARWREVVDHGLQRVSQK